MSDRHSRLTEDSRGPLEELTEKQIAELEARNGLLQFDEMLRMISGAITLPKAEFRLRPSAILDLNRIAVDGLEPTAGTFRSSECEIGGSQHVPPPWQEVPRHVDNMCDLVNRKWESSSPIFLAACVMWRLNWIHPFANGNGRTSRAVSYLVLCARLGYSLPGNRTIPEMIAEDKTPYYMALEAADAAWTDQDCNVLEMEKLLRALLAAQLIDVVKTASGDNLESQQAEN